MSGVRGLAAQFENVAPTPAPRLPPRSSKAHPTSPPATKPASPPARSRSPALPSPLLHHPPVNSFSSVSEPAPVPPRTTADSEEKFGSCLQTCYDAINKRHDDELRALESLRVHVFNRAKADRDYAESLAKINQRASRGLSNVNQSSAVVQAWTCCLEVSECIQKQISSGAAQMSGVILQSIDQLIRDKRGAKKVFDSERSRLDDEYHTSCTTVQSLRRDYRKYLQTTESYKRKLQASLTKDPPKPAEQDKYRKKFVANAEKLHGCHNEYALSILDANAHQDHYRSSLLPFSLDTLQQRMELQISEWKDCMMKYTQAMDLTQVYEESFRRLFESLHQVEKEVEYVEFIKENKREQPPVEHFEFDETLLQGYCSPKVDSGKVVINNLSHNPMKTRLAVLETTLEQHEYDLSAKQEELNALLSTPQETSPTLSVSSSKDHSAQPPRHVKIASLQAEIKELNSNLARKKGQATLIKEAVDNMGDAPPALFDMLGEGVDVKDLDTTLTVGGSATTSKRGGKITIGTLKHGMGKRMGRMKGMFKKAGRKRTESLESGPGEVTRSPSEDTMPDGSVADDSDASSTYDEPPEIPVEDEEWFFGDIDRKLAESKCKVNGDYLVRYSARQNKYVLTCCINNQAKHFVIQQITDETGQIKFRFESKAFSSIRELLEYHVTYGMPVTKASGAVISRFITKFDKWALRHEDVKISKKIGKGCFGDVWEATLATGAGGRVAVKTCRSSDLQDMDKFLKEAEILKQYDHPNIVKLIGICAEKEPVYIVMEFMPGGAFLDFLRKKGGHQTKQKLCLMCTDAAKGMAYLESNNCIHRDLAARNCLVGDDDILKISDFGMSREDEGGIYIVSAGTRQIPIKWTAPEALNYGKYTSCSDVWSYGILLWEAFSCGSSPYPGMSNHEARTQIDVGYRMPPPADCPQEVYGIMQQCWQYDPEERPDFATIVEMLTKAGGKIDN